LIISTESYSKCKSGPNKAQTQGFRNTLVNLAQTKHKLKDSGIRV